MTRVKRMVFLQIPRTTLKEEGIRVFIANSKFEQSH